MAKARYTEFSGLLNIGATDFIKQANELEACKNCYEYEIGKLQKVPGYSLASSSQVIDNESTNFLHYYHQPSTNNNYLIAGTDNSTNYLLRYIAPNITSPVTTWTSLTGMPITGAEGAEISTVNYLDKVFGVGIYGTTFMTPFTISGITYTTSDGANLTSMPGGKYLVRYRDLLYVLNTYVGSTKWPSRAYYCATPVSGNTSWTPTTDFVEFGYDNGDEITGAIEALDRLVVFKHFSFWKYDEDSVKQVADVGCDSNKSIIKVNGIPYWFNRNGIYRWGGDQPQLISAKVQEYIDAIDQTKLHETIAVQHDFEYRIFIGDVTVRNILYNNCWLCFDTRREKWYVRCTFNEVKSTCEFVYTGKKRAYFGDDDGYVYRFATKIDNIYSDNGNEIDSFFITNNLDFGAPEDKKFSSDITIFSKNPQGMNLSIDADNQDQFSASRGTVLNKNVEDDIQLNASAFRYRFKFNEKSKNQSWQFEGFVVETEIKEEQ